MGEKERKEETRAGEKRRRRRSRSDSTGLIRSGSIRPVRFEIQIFEFLLCLGIENEIQKFRKNSRKLRKIRRLQIYF